MPRQTLVTYSGRQADGGEIFNMTFDYPLPLPNDWPPTDNQRRAVREFFGLELEQETEWQAHALLTCRDYAWEVIDRVGARATSERRIILARFVASFVSNTPEIRADVIRLADRRWRDGRDPDRRGVARTKHFKAVERWLLDAIADMREAGSGI